MRPTSTSATTSASSTTNLTRVSSVSTGQIYSSVIAKERRGDYSGETVQVVPHITNEIKSRILALAEDADVVITEVGGTVGDIEGLPFIEAIRQLRYDVGRENICYVHCALVPFIGPTGELKTKPAQHSVRELRSIGIQPDAVVCRADRPLPLRAQAQDRAAVGRRARGRRLRARRQVDLRGAADPARRGPGPLRGPAPGPGPRGRARPRRLARDGAPPARARRHRHDRAGRQVRRAARRLPQRRRGAAARQHPPRRRPRHPLGAGRRPHAAVRRRARAGGRARDPRAGRLRAARHRGQDQRRPRRPRARGALPRHLPGPADGRDRVRPPRAGPAGGALLGDGGLHARPGGRPHGRPARRRRPRRHDAPGRVPLQGDPRHEGRGRVRRAVHLRAPPPPLGGQQPLPRRG